MGSFSFLYHLNISASSNAAVVCKTGGYHNSTILFHHDRIKGVSVFFPETGSLFRPHDKKRGGKGICQSSVSADNGNGDQSVFSRISGPWVKDMVVGLSIFLKIALIAA